MAGAHHARKVRLARERTRHSDFGFFLQKTSNNNVSLSEYDCSVPSWR
jgi:hypothetical protein